MYCTQVGSVSILGFSETVGYEETEEFKAKIKSLIEEGYLYFAIDMSEVECITSAGLGMIFTAHKELQKLNGRLVLFNLKPQVIKSIKDWRLDRFIPYYSSKEEACAALQASNRLAHQ